MIDFSVSLTVIILAAITLFFPVGCMVKGIMKKRRATRPVEYYPPRGYSPIDVMLMFYGKRSVPRELFNPLMLYWAQKGYITIEEDCKRGLKLTKIKDMPSTSDSPTHDIQLELFRNMFAASDVFCTLAATSADGINLETFMSRIKKRAAEEVNVLSKRLSYVSVAIAAICTLISGGLFISCTRIGVTAMLILFSTIGVFALWALLTFGDRPDDGKQGLSEKKIKLLLILFFCVWGGVPFSVLFFAATDMGAVLAISVISIFAATIANLFFLSKKIDIRSNENLAFYGRIDAFKTFLVDAELDKLETLVEEDPDYFYDVLPYCYILRITEKLKPKFDAIALDGPSWYLGNLRETLMF